MQSNSYTLDDLESDMKQDLAYSEPYEYSLSSSEWRSPSTTPLQAKGAPESVYTIAIRWHSGSCLADLTSICAQAVSPRELRSTLYSCIYRHTTRIGVNHG